MHQEAQKSYKGYFHMQFFEGKNAQAEALEALDQLLQSLLSEGIDLKDDWKQTSSIAHSAVQQFYGDLTEEQIAKISRAELLPLYERIQTIIDALQLVALEGAAPYITTFQDIVYQFTKNRVADAAAFIDFWKRKSSKFTIPATKTTNTIQIMTIHSSKGLEFDIVILPKLSWPIMSFHQEDIIWCVPKTAPFNTMPIVAVHPSERLMRTHLKDDLIQEKVAQYTDYLNLTYVALTRPRYRLYAFGEKFSTNKKEEVSIKNIGHLFSYLYHKNGELNEQLIYAKMDNGTDKPAPLPPLKDEKKKEDEDKEKDKKNNEIRVATYVSESIDNRLILRSRSEDDFDPDTPLSIVDLGIKMHLWLSHINTWSDAEPSLLRMTQE